MLKKITAYSPMALAVILLCSSPVSAQISFPGRWAQNTCWYMSKGLVTSTAIKFAGDPIHLLVDKRGVTPGYVLQNAQYIGTGMNAWKSSVGEDQAIKYFMRELLNTCGNRLSTEEYNEMLKYIKQ
jgi:hypothetical protein